MGFISSIQSERKVEFSFYSKTISVVNGVVQPEAGTLVKKVEGIFWTGTQNLSLVSEKLKTSVDGAVAIDYDSTIAAMSDDSWFLVDSDKYRIIHVENVGQQNEMLQILYERDKSN